MLIDAKHNVNPLKPDVFCGLAKIMPWPYLLCDRKGKILYANLHFKRLLDRGELGIEGMHVGKIFSGNDAGSAVPEVLSRVSAAEAWHGRWQFDEAGGVLPIEFVVQVDPFDAALLWIIALEHPVINDQVLLGAKSELRLLQILMDHTLDYVYFKDNAGRFVITNRAFQSALNVPYPGFEIGKTLSDFTNDEVSLAFDETDRKVLTTLEPQINEAEFFRLKFGSGRWLQTTKMPVFNRNRKCIGLVCVSRDISEARENEEKLNKAVDKAEQANQAKSDFLANMSHEIRTPINGIIGMAELCMDTVQNAEQQSYLDTIMNCTSTLLALINDILDFSKIEAGQLELEAINFSFRECIEEVAEAFIPQTREKGIELALQLNPNLPALVLGDPIRIKQILNNLLSNALKFTDEGEITVSAETVHDRDGFSTLQLTVSDTGIGIPVERQHAVFNSFTQADNSTTRNYGGTGLGLAICRQLVELMDGHISLFSRPGKGSTFKVVIQLRTLHPSTEPANQKLAALKNLSVLIIDDNQTSRQILNDLCRNWDFNPRTAASGLEGLDMLETAERIGEPIQLVLLDQQMPSLSGLDLAALIANRPHLDALKIVLFSSSLSQSEAQRALEIGVHRHLSKPLKQAAFLEVILDLFESTASPPVSNAIPVNAGSTYPKAPGQESLTILVAEDNHVNQEVCQRRLERLGHNVLIVENGEQAVEAYQQSQFDLILMDVQMPIMDGLVATQKIREVEAEEERYTPIIAMTARAMKHDEAQCLAAGMDAYMAKPFRASKLTELLQQVARRELVTPKHHMTQQQGEYPWEHLSNQTLTDLIADVSDEDVDDIKAAGEVFLEYYQTDLACLKQYFEDHAWDKLNHQAHSIKGAVALFEAHRLQAIAFSIEKAALRRNSPMIADVLPTFEQEIHDLAHALRRLTNDEHRSSTCPS